jgi:hypothetical protein
MHGNWGSDLLEKDFPGYQSGGPTPNTLNGSTAENVSAGFYRSSTANTVLENARRASVGVEFAPTSMGRGGFDEIIANNSPNSTAAQQVSAARGVEKGLLNSTPTCQFVEWVDHGYGIVHLTGESATFEYWWQDKLTPDAPDVLGNQMIAFATDDTSLSHAHGCTRAFLLVVEPGFIWPARAKRAGNVPSSGWCWGSFGVRVRSGLRAGQARALGVMPGLVEFARAGFVPAPGCCPIPPRQTPADPHPALSACLLARARQARGLCSVVLFVPGSLATG